MQLIIGTTNPAKIEQVQNALHGLDLTIIGLPNQEFAEVKENGRSTSENARCKALYYSSVLQAPVLSMDNALYFLDLPAEKQPGLQVRRVPGKVERLSDQEVLDYYCQLVASLGGSAEAYWEFGFCLAYPDGSYQELVTKTPRQFVAKPSQIMTPGYPLESISFDPVSGKYIAELNPAEKIKLSQQTIGPRLYEFIKNSRLFY